MFQYVGRGSPIEFKYVTKIINSCILVVNKDRGEYRVCEAPKLVKR